MCDFRVCLLVDESIYFLATFIKIYVYVNPNLKPCLQDRYFLHF